MRLTQISFMWYHPFRFYSVAPNPVYQNRVDEASAACKEVWDHDLAHNPYFKDLFNGAFYEGTRCNKVPCCGCERWYGPRDVLVFA